MRSLPLSTAVLTRSIPWMMALFALALCLLVSAQSAMAEDAWWRNPQSRQVPRTRKFPPVIVPDKAAPSELTLTRERRQHSSHQAAELEKPRRPRPTLKALNTRQVEIADAQLRDTDGGQAVIEATIRLLDPTRGRLVVVASSKEGAEINRPRGEVARTHGVDWKYLEGEIYDDVLVSFTVPQHDARDEFQLKVYDAGRLSRGDLEEAVRTLSLQ